MTNPEQIEEQCIRMFGQVFGNPMQTMDDLRRGFYQQEMSVIAGWERLARSIGKVTTPATLEYVSLSEHREALEQKDKGWLMRLKIEKIRNGTWKEE